MRRSQPTGMHACPGRCGALVPHHRFACPDCWWELPPELRREIQTHYRRDPIGHLQAMNRASAWLRGRDPNHIETENR